MKLNLKKTYFDEKEFVLLEAGEFRATSFRYSSGVEALKIENSRGYFIILPFQGQQIWRAGFCGHELTMKTKMEEPVPTKVLLENHGGLVSHCGICAFGVPQADDNHPHHGELPNADFDSAYITIEDDYIAVGGTYNYDVAFAKNYSFTPECRLHKGDTVLKFNITLENKRNSPMDYMYLCHMNFLPVDGAELFASAGYENMKIFSPVNDETPQEAKEKFAAFIREIEKDPAFHHKIGRKEEYYNPELCFGIYDYKADSEGMAHTMQMFSGGAFFVSHEVEALPIGIRWISRNGTEDALGMVLPATAEHIGYSHAKRNGQLKFLPPYGSVSFKMEAGYLEPERAQKMRETIEKIK